MVVVQTVLVVARITLWEAVRMVVVVCMMVALVVFFYAYFAQVVGDAVSCEVHLHGFVDG
jgi:Ca2+/Na+ antiporter